MPVSPQCRGSSKSAPYWTSPDGFIAKLYLGDARDCLRRLPARSVHCVVTSPPYWSLRDYGVSGQIGLEPSPDCNTSGQAQCSACFVCSMMGVMREVYRVLRDDGTLWLNLGDSYSSGGRGGGAEGSIQESNVGSLLGAKHCNIPPNNLVGIPWRVALALQMDGWILRQDIIWHSPDKMPESVTNRCTKSHEHIFLLAKSGEYYFDHIAIREKSKTVPHAPGNRKIAPERNDRGHLNEFNRQFALDGQSNKRDVWIVPKGGYVGDHFATFSPQLITPCILAGTSEHGCCAKCGKPWERVIVKIGGQRVEPDKVYIRDDSITGHYNGKNGALDGTPPEHKTVGWRKSCGCATDKIVPCTVLDPFVGTGTTVATSIRLGRNGIGIDLSESYLTNDAIPRINNALNEEKSEKKPTIALTQGTPLPPVAID